MKRIADLQVREDPFFLPGIFPSYITNKPKFKEQIHDNNIFYNGLILFTLKDAYPFLSVTNQRVYDSMVDKSRSLFSRFKNTNGRPTYNFWPTDSAFKFPYTRWIYRVRGPVSLPDDMDDTVFALMALDAPDSVVYKAHSIMQLYVNSDSNRVKSSDRRYRNIPAYSTWFGKKFPVVFDVSVISNVLSFVQIYQMPWQKADSASLQLLIKTIKHRDHVKQPQYVSPYYGTTALILYHLSRLMSIKKIPELEALKVSLIKDAMQEYIDTDNYLERIIISTALLKWGYLPPAMPLPAINDIERIIERNDMPFFIGNIPSYFPRAIKKEFVKRNLGLFYHFCPAYNNALLLEYLLLKNQTGLTP